MPIRAVPGTERQQYYLIAFDKLGAERQGDHAGLDGLLSRRITRDLAERRPTDIFFFSHGWNGDMDDAERQYDAWTGMVAERRADIERIQQLRGELRPMMIGVHWPSKAWGDERTGGSFGAGADRAAGTPALDVDALVESFVERLGEESRDDVRTIVAVAAHNNRPEELSSSLKGAFKSLEQRVLPPRTGPGGAPGSDRGPLNVDGLYDKVLQSQMASFGQDGLGGGLLDMLRVFTFWSMKDRARSFGAGGGHQLLHAVQDAAPEARVHLMGHSFGCIVVSAMAAGAAAGGAHPRPISSLVLVEGALSCWAYSPQLLSDPGTPGYFHRIIADRLVSGPIVAVHSDYDYAVGRYYPLGARMGGPTSFADPGPFSALGRFGAQGVGAASGALRPPDQRYNLTGGSIYNFDGSAVIKALDGPGGAHNDIVHPELGHLIWEAAMAG